MMTHKKAIVLFSGGMDSMTCLAIAKSQGYDIYALSFDYGQRHRAELNAAKKLAKKWAVQQHQIIPLAISQLGGSALTDPTIPVPDFSPTAEPTIPVTYVPARNTVFLSIALGYAEIVEARDIFIGVSAVDYSGYPDCRPEYIAAFQTLANLATKAGVEGDFFTLHTPLIHLSKAQTIQAGIALGIDYRETVTCYRATEAGLACGTCPSCVLRQKGFKEADLEDMTYYSTDLLADKF